MRAMLLAAGKGKRMRPLTDTCPKPLLTVLGKPLIVHHIERLATAGFRHLVVNVGHLGQQIMDALGDGRQWDVTIQYSDERDGVLETAGGIIKALPLLGDKPFLVVNSDIWTAFSYSSLSLKKGDLAHLVLVDNPSHHQRGDFSLEQGRVRNNQDGYRLTFSGIGLYHPDLFQSCQAGPAPLAPLLRQAIDRCEVGGEYYAGEWLDIGTPERLMALNSQQSGMVRQ